MDDKPRMKRKMMNIEPLKGMVPDEVLEQIDSLEKFGINTPLRLAHFLAQCAHESAGFKAKVENLNYSAKALRAVFGKYFPGDLSEKYHRKSVLIGARVYANRMGNGDEASREGYTFRGRGYIQLTGKNNYRKFGESIGVDIVSFPAKVSEDYPLLSAAWFFHINNLNRYADLGATDIAVRLITKRVNGGYHGYIDRLDRFKRFWQALS